MIPQVFFEIDSELEEIVEDERGDEATLGDAKKLGRMRAGVLGGEGGVGSQAQLRGGSLSMMSSYAMGFREEDATAGSPREVELY